MVSSSAVSRVNDDTFSRKPIYQWRHINAAQSYDRRTLFVIKRGRRLSTSLCRLRPTATTSSHQLLMPSYSCLCSILFGTVHTSVFILLNFLLSATILLSFEPCIYSLGHCSYHMFLCSLSIFFVKKSFQFIMVNNCVVGGFSSDPRTFNFPKDLSRRRVSYICLTRSDFSSSSHSMPRLCRGPLSE